MTEQPPSVKAVFDRALEIAAAAQRQAYLDEACAGMPELRHRVEALLQAYQDAGSFLEKPAPDLGPTVASQPAPPADADSSGPSNGADSGTVIGSYKLLQPIGEGGMGAVWMAEQTQPVQRKVALKIIKAGMDSRQVLARFEAERQALALMDHPNIAKVHDGGATAAGRPYFVMELVKGVPITRYCDEHRLTPRERLELFVPVCQAIQHAHHKGIIHRDVKPSNVQVAPYDGKPVVKVIDFGIAKATGQRLTEKTLFTEFGAVVGTLEYMSPEQAELNNQDIDTRSDVYSLGVLLYELLTGSTPLDRARLRQAAFTEMLRIIREVEPPKPSTRISESKDTLPSISAQRQTEPGKLMKLVRGDLDWIVMKALEKDRSRRYETANGFAADVQRYLADEPVQACPPSAWYRLGKLARRNRIALTTTAVVTMALVLGTAVSVWQAVVATQALIAQQQATYDKEQAKEELDQENDKQRTRVNSEISAALVRLTDLQGKVQAAGPAEIPKWADALRDARNPAELLAASLLAEPGSARKLRELLKTVGQVEKDRRTVARVEDLRIRSTLFHPRIDPLARRPNEDTYAAIFRDYGIPLADLDVEEAARMIRDSAIQETLVVALDDWAGLEVRVVGPNAKQLRIARAVVGQNPWRREYFDALLGPDLGTTRRQLRELALQPAALEQTAGALTMLGRRLLFNWETAVDLLRRAQVRHPTDTLINLELGFEYGKSAQVANQREAAVYYGIAFALRPDSLYLLDELGKHLFRAGEFDKALSVYQEHIHRGPLYDTVWLQLAAMHRQKRDWDGAVRVYRDLAEKRRNPLARCGIGMVLAEKGELEAASAEFKEVIRLYARAKVENRCGEAYAGLGWVLERQGKGDEALKAYKESILQLYRGGDFPDHSYDTTPDPHSGLVRVLQKQGVPDSAQVAFRDMASILQEKKGMLDQPHQIHFWLAGGIADEMARQGDWDAVIALLAPRNGFHQLKYGRALLRKGRLDEAILELNNAMYGEFKADGVLVIREVAAALEKNGRLDDALRFLRMGVWQRPQDAEIQYLIGNILKRQDKQKEALVAYKEALRWKPDFHDARYKLGTTLAELGEIDLAIAAYRHLLGFVENFEGVHRDLGIALARQGKGEEALIALHAAVRWSPRDAAAHYHLGNALEKRGQWEEAIAEYRAAVRLQPELAAAHTALKSALPRLEKSEKALAGLAEAVRSRPEDAEAHYRLGKELARLDKLDEAVAAFRAALKLRPHDGLVLHDLGKALFRQDRFDQAIAAYREAVGVQPDAIQARADLGYALFRSGKFDEAVVVLREVVRRKDDNPGAHGNLGIVLARQGKWKEAIAAFRKAVQLRPDDAIGYYNLGYALCQTGNSSEGIDAYREAYRRQPDEALALANVSALLLRQERVDEAVAAGREALRRRPDMAEAHLTLDSALECEQLIALQPDECQRHAVFRGRRWRPRQRVVEERWHRRRHGDGRGHQSQHL